MNDLNGGNNPYGNQLRTLLQQWQSVTIQETDTTTKTRVHRVLFEAFIQAVMRHKGFSVVSLAAAATTPVETIHTVLRCEMPLNPPNESILKRIATVLDLPPVIFIEAARSLTQPTNRDRHNSDNLPEVDPPT